MTSKPLLTTLEGAVGVVDFYVLGLLEVLEIVLPFTLFFVPVIDFKVSY